MYRNINEATLLTGIDKFQILRHCNKGDVGFVLVGSSNEVVDNIDDIESLKRNRLV